MGKLGPTELLLIFAILLPGILYVRTLGNTLNKCSIQNRKMQPSQVWFLLIPLFNLVWQFIVFVRLSDTLRKEYQVKNIRFKGDMGETVGIFFGISVIVHVIASATGTQFMLFPTIILWIVHWIKIAGYSTTLSQQIPNQPPSDTQ